MSSPSDEQGVWGVLVNDIPDRHGGIIKNIIGVDISKDTVTPDTLLKGETAHDAQGNPITGTMIAGGETTCICFDVIFEDDSDFSVCFCDDCCGFNIEFSDSITVEEYEEFLGPYIVTPMNFEQTLDTDKKLMKNDVTVLEVTYAETDNLYGGLTVTIGTI